MPGFDGTGPRGQGPMTGGGRGFCAVPFTGKTPGYFGRRFFGRGGGRGRGFRNWFFATGIPGWARAGFWPFGSCADQYDYEVGPKKEIAAFKEQAEILQEQLKDIQERISILQKADDEAAKK